MRRYLANGKCVLCHSDKNVVDVLLTVNKRSLVVSICSESCFSTLRKILANERSRKRFLKSFLNLGSY